MAVSTEEARRMALSLPGAVEASHFDNPDFRVGKKIFAAFPGPDRMTLRLTPQEQAAVLAEDPETFSAKGHWGRLGWTFVNLSTVDPEQLRELITEAWRGKAPKRLVAEFDNATG